MSKKIVIPKSDGKEYWDSKNREFIYTKDFPGMTIEIEHSLYSISKWEEKWCKQYLGTEQKTAEENLDYIKCMTITENVPDIAYDFLTEDNIQEIGEYINGIHSALDYTKLTKSKPQRGGDKMASETIYCMMVLGNIPFECQYWNFSRLMTLIECVGIKNSPPKKMSKSDLMKRNANLNKARRAKMNSRG